MTMLRYAMCALLALGTLGHIYGTFAFYAPGTDEFVWSLSGGAFAASVVAMNLLFVPGNRGQVALACVSALAWASLALAFGFAIGNPADPRVIAHVIPALALVALDARLLFWRPVSAGA